MKMVVLPLLCTFVICAATEVVALATKSRGVVTVIIELRLSCYFVAEVVKDVEDAVTLVPGDRWRCAAGEVPFGSLNISFVSLMRCCASFHLTVLVVTTRSCPTINALCFCSFGCNHSRTQTSSVGDEESCNCTNENDKEFRGVDVVVVDMRLYCSSVVKDVADAVTPTHGNGWRCAGGGVSVGSLYFGSLKSSFVPLMGRCATFNMTVLVGATRSCPTISASCFCSFGGNNSCTQSSCVGDHESRNCIDIDDG